MPRAATTEIGATSVRRCRRPNAAGSCPCSPSEYASRPKPGDRRRRGGEQDQRAGDPDIDAQRLVGPVGTCRRAPATIPISGARSQSVPSCVVPSRDGKAESPTSAIRT